MIDDRIGTISPLSYACRYNKKNSGGGGVFSIERSFILYEYNHFFLYFLKPHSFLLDAYKRKASFQSFNVFLLPLRYLEANKRVRFYSIS